MSGHEDFTSLEALPPCVGDAPVAALLLRDLAASTVVASGRHGGVLAAAVAVSDDGRFELREGPEAPRSVDAEHAPLTAPELFDGDAPDASSDVYAAACLALTRYLGGAPVPVAALARRAPTTIRIGAQRQAHRTVPARLGTLPEPYRSVFTQAVAKAPHLRPTPERVVAMLDAAFAAASDTTAADARARVGRLVALARAFVPIEVPATAAAAAAAVPASTGGALHLPLRSLPAFTRPSGVARVALIAAVAVVATGGVAVAAVAGLSGGSSKTPQAVSTHEATPTASVSVAPVAKTSAAKPTSAPTSVVPPAPRTTPPAAGAPANDNSGAGSGAGSYGNGSGGSGSGGNGSNGTGSNGNGSNGGGSGGGSTPPPAPPSSPSSQPPTQQSSVPQPPPATQTPHPAAWLATGSGSQTSSVSPSASSTSTASTPAADPVPTTS